MLEHIARAIDARRLAIPDAEHAIELRARKQVRLLRAPHSRRPQILVQPLPELHVMRIHQLGRRADLLVVSPERRTPVARDETRRIKARFPVEPLAVQRQAHKRMYAGHEGPAALEQIFVVEGNSTGYRCAVLQGVRLLVGLDMATANILLNIAGSICHSVRNLACLRQD